ncbi:valine--tRNA ligase, partial [bacterium]|nr:valine--tRNA ligase [bacterium]
TKYQPKKVEEKWYKYWLDKGYFHAEVDRKRKPFTVVIPPPNITGSLHMGHALNSTLQDILVRYKRMRGYNACWIPGTDHAGIATQNVVEKELLKEGKSRFDLGRERFIERVWQWKERYGGRIIEQLKRLGCSCDWERLRFTLDRGCSEAVTESFVKLYEKGLIYRDEYIINWCPRCQTALSDIEVEHEDEKGYLYYIKYPFKTTGQSNSPAHLPTRPPAFITVATTRPETMLGDTAVAVNPKDRRFKGLIGKTLILPIMNREIPLIADDYVDPEFGTGALKITPAHDPNDFEIGRKHRLPEVRVIDTSGRMTKEARKYEGLDRYECRKRLLEDLRKKGYLEKKEDYLVPVGRCYRCSTPIEPLISLQWFLKVKDLAKPAIEVVKRGKIQYIPKRWEKVYLDWMAGLKDWCLSRQIWWGHRIPVYYCKRCLKKTGIRNAKCKMQNVKLKTEGIIVARAKPKQCPKCGNKNLVQDPDVLDTWFSSALWPFSTLGWPEKTKDLAYFYPTSLLITGHEIIHLWVARMIKMGLELMGDIPFSEVYIHGIVRDKKGKKMSKSLGNVIDPLDIISQYGTDALRFTLTSSCAQGQDLQLFDEKFTSNRNFANKIWNASRFVLMNLTGFPYQRINLSPPKADQPLAETCQLTLADRWIFSRYNKTVKEVTDSIENYRISEAAQTLYQFIWHEFCDWYLEMIKPILYQEVKSKKAKVKSKEMAQYVMWHVLEGTLRLLHPFMPFITEEIWQALQKTVGQLNCQTAKLSNRQTESIMISSWPEVNRRRINAKIEKEMALVIGVTTSIRNIRSEMGIVPQKKIEAILKIKRKDQLKIIDANVPYIRNLAGVSKIKIGPDVVKPVPSASAVIGEIVAWVPLKGLIDPEKERGRLKRQMDKIEKELKRTKEKLKNKEFLNKAPERVIVKEKKKEKELKEKSEKLKKNLKSL